jgi:4-hydroxy-2-oxoheptanedioate aldolase
MAFQVRLNRLKKKLLSGQDSSWVLLDIMSVEIVEILGMLGFDSFLMEGEHAALNEDKIQDLVRAAERFEMTPTIRLRTIDFGQVGRLLDIGVQGIQATHIRSAADAEHLVKCTRYPPLGQRGFGRFSRLNCFGMADEADALKCGNEAVLVTIAIEDLEGAENIAEILKTDGLDMVVIGPSDLSASMGIPGQYENPRFQGVIEKIRSAIASSRYSARGHGKRIGGDSVSLVIAQALGEVLAGKRSMGAFRGLDVPKS